MDDELSNQSEAISSSVVITENELRGILNVKGNSGKEKISFLEIERNHWKELPETERTAEREQRALLYVRGDGRYCRAKSRRNKVKIKRTTKVIKNYVHRGRGRRRKQSYKVRKI
ncbi:Hypothetical predicted protein [Paramuricea clavata]|uniref:Uncharacterized protein n=1 Tax=Paramuricea clavata TaxID=317549 RepID=A0A6S7FYZ7_PARCT|nr:Hypothetical predicted protein [Paramuricea clavata]